VGRKLWVPGAVLGLVVLFSAAFFYSDSTIERDLAEQARRTEARAEHLQSQVVLFSESAVPRGLPFNVFLQRFGIDADTTAELAASVQPVFDLRQLRAGNEFAIGRSVLGDLRALRYRIDADRMLLVRPEGDDFHAEIRTIPSVTETVGVGGEVHGSLFEGITDIGERPELAMRLADIFGYDLDFYTDTRPGDTFRVVVERKKLTNGTVVSYGRILAAEYNNEGHAYRAVLFHDASGRSAYFTPEGKSLKKAFLHSPLKFAAPVTSHFSKSRFHPILRRYRPHLGTDYGAPIGTPVQSIGEGKVVFAGRKGGAGNLVEVRHTNGYETYYMHLSRILVRTGQHVNEGQRIGLVGMTGLATGPHLDFRIERHGQFLNFERLSLPSAEPVARRDWNEFAAVRNHAIGQLPNLGAVLARNRAPASASSAR
jgi:murein DD-endopeptidase MepM/ murein hydrolase activator NlpD